MFYVNRSHHNDFTGVGMAVPERVNLFRVQALRGVGGNGWRMSHNPYRDTLYDTMDRLGVLVWDETRDLRGPQLSAFKQMVSHCLRYCSVDDLMRLDLIPGAATS